MGPRGLVVHESPGRDGRRSGFQQLRRGASFAFDWLGPFTRTHAAAYQKHRSRFRSYGDYPWSLRPDAFYKVWLLGLERVENNVFVADLKYVKDYPNE